ncbi:MAG: inositol monophosphatase [Gemmatimonadota bacterium]
MAAERLEPAAALVVAREAAAAGAAALRAAWRETGRGSARAKAPGDLVTEADHQAEARIVERIQDAYPDHAIVAEESGLHGDGDDVRYRWIVDPLDGTANFVHRIPAWAVSIALVEVGSPIVGVVVDPLRDEWFTAVAGRGATHDRGDPGDATPIEVSPSTDLDEAILATGFPFRQPHEIDRYMGAFDDLFRRVSDMRRIGSAAIDLAYVAAGRVEGFWEIGLKPWDIAAGELIVLEAGGRVSDWRGGMEHRSTGWIAAGNPVTHDLLLEVLSAYAAEPSLAPIVGKS